MIPVNEKFRITDEVERYLLVIYLVIVLLSSLVGDSFILIASVRHSAIKLNKFIIAVMQHIALGDLMRSATCILPVVTSLIADQWVLGRTMAYINLYLNIFTFISSNLLICVLTSSKFLMLQFPEQTQRWTKRRAHVACAIVWLGSFVFVVTLYARSHHYNELSFDYARYVVTFNDNSSVVLVFVIVSVILPTLIIILTTFATLCYLLRSIQAAHRIGGRLRWQGMVTVTVTAIVYCISVLPYMTAQFCNWAGLGPKYSEKSVYRFRGSGAF